MSIFNHSDENGNPDNHKLCKELGKDLARTTARYFLQPAPVDHKRKRGQRRQATLTQQNINKRRV